jgi:hypothetical protein
MSSANVELARSILLSWERADFSVSEWADPAIEFAIADGPDSGTVTGLSAMASGWRDFLTAWDGYRVRADEFRVVDEHRVLVVLHAAGRGKTSGVELGSTSERGANLFHITNGKVTRLLVYFSHRQALADLGLAPADQ